MTETPEASVCIASHKRPEGLRKLLQSLVEQTAAPPFEVIVVDNDAGRSGEAVAAEFGTRLQLTYLVEPVQGIARARNRSVAASRGTYIAFIDDDEWATPTWLAELARKAEECAADVVIGPVTIIFEETVPDHIRSSVLFRRAQIRDGLPVPWNLTHTSNAYVRRAALPDIARPFDVAFDLTGGEDSDLFSRMIKRGATVIGATAAGVFEYRGARRANLRWLLRRSLRNGTNLASLEWASLGRWRRLNLARRSAWAAVREGAKGTLQWRRDRKAGTMHFIRMADRFGRFAGCFGVRVREYRVHP